MCACLGAFGKAAVIITCWRKSADIWTEIFKGNITFFKGNISYMRCISVPDFINSCRKPIRVGFWHFLPHYSWAHKRNIIVFNEKHRRCSSSLIFCEFLCLSITQHLKPAGKCVIIRVKTRENKFRRHINIFEHS